VIHFTRHVQDKFAILEAHHCSISQAQVIDAITNSDLVDRSRAPLLIAQKRLSATHVLRVVFKKEGNDIIIITFYPGRRKHYEQQKS